MVDTTERYYTVNIPRRYLPMLDKVVERGWRTRTQTVCMLIELAFHHPSLLGVPAVPAEEQEAANVEPAGR